MGLERGKLSLSKKGKLQINIDGTSFCPAQADLSQTLPKELKVLNGFEVEYEREGGRPKKIRDVGGEFVPPIISGINVKKDPRQKGNREDYYKQQQNAQCDDAHNYKADFHNPYNFIPAPPRVLDDPDLGDYKPVDQDRLHMDRVTGSIRVEMETITPILVPDTEHVNEDNGHKTYNLLKGNDGKPLIPSSGVRGMLRSAYEAVTNSRLSRFSKQDHGKRLAYRMQVEDGLRLIPARIENGAIHLLTGTSSILGDGSPDGSQYAAWLPRYRGIDKSTDTNDTKRYSNGLLPEHGDEVDCIVELIQHYRWNKKRSSHSPDFKYWRVKSIVKAGGRLHNIVTNISESRNGRSWHESIGQEKRIHGWVCISNANIDRKHDERVFFSDSSSLDMKHSFSITDTHRNKWLELIGNYQDIHQNELKKRDNDNIAYDHYISREPGRTAWSRHVYLESEKELKDGILCYVRLTENQDDVEALFPVMIARELYSASPWDLLHPSLRPASTFTELSPADRIFGWVLTDLGKLKAESEEKMSTAVRGLLRVGPVICESTIAEAIEDFPDEGVPLAILASPKPQQGRFYVAKSQNGDAQDDRLPKDKVGYSSGKGLRGRKVYPHHKALPEYHWDNPMEDRTPRSQGPWQEYRRPDSEKLRNDQNHSIRGWVKPGCRFVFELHVTNLSKMELGALLWLLDLPENHYHRFGGGKPLGFGSIRLKAINCELFTGDELRKRYSAWDVEHKPNTISKSAVSLFRIAVERAYARGGEIFETIPFISSFLFACQGFNDDLPIHYPRVTDDGLPGPPRPDGESFKWFEANDKGPGYALGNLAEDKGFPTLKDPKTQSNR